MCKVVLHVLRFYFGCFARTLLSVRNIFMTYTAATLTRASSLFCSSVIRMREMGEGARKREREKEGWELPLPLQKAVREIKERGKEQDARARIHAWGYCWLNQPFLVPCFHMGCISYISHEICVFLNIFWCVIYKKNDTGHFFILFFTQNQSMKDFLIRKKHFVSDIYYIINVQTVIKILWINKKLN